MDICISRVTFVKTFNFELFLQQKVKVNFWNRVASICKFWKHYNLNNHDFPLYLIIIRIIIITIMPNDLQNYQQSFLSAIVPVNYHAHAYQPLCLYAIMPICHHANLPSYLSAIMLSTILPIKPSCLSAIMPISYHTVCSNMIVIKVFDHKIIKIEFIGSIFDLNSTQVWAILCKCVILKKN